MVEGVGEAGGDGAVAVVLFGEVAAALAHGAAVGEGEGGEFFHGVGEGGGLVGGDGEAALGFDDLVAGGADAEDDGPGGGHVVVEFIGADAVFKKAAAEEGDDAGGGVFEDFGDLGAGDGAGEADVADGFGFDALAEAGEFGAFANEVDLDIGATAGGEEFGGVEEGIEAVGVADGAAVIDIDGGAFGFGRGSGPGIHVDAVGEPLDGAAGCATAFDVINAEGEEGEDAAGAAVEKAFEKAEGEDGGVEAGVAAEFDEGFGPEVADFEDVGSAMAAGESPGGGGLKEVGAGAPDNGGGGEPGLGNAAQDLAREDEHVFDAAGVIAVVGGDFEPEEGDAGFLAEAKFLVGAEEGFAAGDVVETGGDDDGVPAEFLDVLGEDVVAGVAGAVGRDGVLVDDPDGFQRERGGWWRVRLAKAGCGCSVELVLG